MPYLLKAPTIGDPSSSHHGRVMDVRIENDTIQHIADSIDAQDDDTVWQAKGSLLSPAWVDLKAQLGDPGLEHLEDLTSGTATALAGGYSHVGISPDTDPWIANKSQVTYLKNKASNLPIGIVPLAAIAKPERPQELTEMLDLAQVGVNVFTQGDRAIADAGFLKRAMQYVSAFGGRLMLHPQMAGLCEDGHMNEGITNIQLGLAGNPPMAEHIAIKRDLELCRYTGAKIHFSKVTTAHSLKLIAEAKQEGLPITCDTGIQYLVYHEQHLHNYPTNLKLDPPLRTPEDQEALIEALRNGVVDALISDHQPVQWEAKACEFPLATPGAIGLQTTLPLLMKALKWEDFVNAAIPALTTIPRQLLDLDPVKIEKGFPAHLTLYNPNEEWVLDENTNQSRSTNTICYGQNLRGLVTGVFKNGQFYEAPQALAAKP